MVISRERSLTHYEVLGVSPTSEPEIIEAAHQSLISKYGDQDHGAERIRRIEEAYEALKDPQRRRTYDARIGKSAPVVADVKTWTVKPRASSSKAAPSSPAVVTTREPVTAPPTKARRGGPRRKPSPSHDPAVSGNPNATNRPAAKRPAARHLIFTPDPSVEQAPASLSELLLPADDSPEEPPRREFGWSRVGLPLAGVVAVIAAALSAQYLFNGSSPDTDGAGVQRQGPAAAGQQPIMPTADGTRGADQEVLFEGGNQQLVSAQAGRPAEAGVDPRQMIAVQESSGTAQIDPSSTTGSEGSVAAQSASPAPAMAARGASQAAPPAVAEKQQVVPSATQQSKAAPARWISGGLEDSDNPGGRFEGSVGVRIIVRPDGYAGACHVAQSSGNPALDDITCQLVQRRLQFDPARNAAGQAMQSEVLTTYTWGRKVRKK